MYSETFYNFSNNYCIASLITQFLYTLTPIAFFVRLKWVYIDDESYFGFLCLYLNSFLYSLINIYKLKSLSSVLLVCHLPTIIIGIFYLALYYHIFYGKRENNNRKEGLFDLIIIGGSIIIWVLIHFTITKNNILFDVYDWINAVFNVAQYFPIGLNIISLIKRKDINIYALIGTFFGLANCISWLLLAIHALIEAEDNVYYLIVANCLGICVEIAQFVLIILSNIDYFKKKSNNEEITTRIISDDTNYVEIPDSIEKNKEKEQEKEKEKEQVKVQELVQDQEQIQKQEREEQVQKQEQEQVQKQEPEQVQEQVQEQEHMDEYI
jgi:hypothetical protein